MIRSIVLIGLIATSIGSYWQLQLQLPYPIIFWILTGLFLINIVTLARLRNPWPVTDIEFFSQLQLDLLSIGLLLFFSGGASNPFISYLLVPVCIAAATLRSLASWLIALSALGIYSALLFFHIPIPALSPSHSHHQSSINLHIIGMWVNFVISAGLVTYFITDMAKALRQQDDKLRQQREDNLRDEQLLAVATQAAGTAHELATPLSTMKVLVTEMQDDYSELNSGSTNLPEDLQLLSQQLSHCSETLRQLVREAENAKEGTTPTTSVKLFCQQVIDRWLLLNPKVTADIEYLEHEQGVKANFHATVSQSILSLLNNASDAEPKGIKLIIDISSTELKWSIFDNGSGIPVDLADRIGKPFISTKEKGFGLGLFLSHATLNRYGGRINLYNRKEAGTCTELVLPIQEVK